PRIAPPTMYTGVLPPCCRHTRMVAIIRIQASEAGVGTFHPNAMSWSDRIRGSGPPSHTQPNNRSSIFARNHTRGHQPLGAPGHTEIGQGARQPPRNKVAASADTVVMLMYSAR